MVGPNPWGPILTPFLCLVWKRKSCGEGREIGSCLEVGKEQRKEKGKEARTGNISAFGHQKHRMQITCKFYANNLPFLLYPHPLNSWRAFPESSQVFAPRSCRPQTVINLDPSWGPSGPPGVLLDPLGCTSRKSLASQPHFYLSKLSTSFASRTEGSGS